MLLLKRINELSPVVQQIVRDRLWSAEHNIAWLRIFVVGFNTLIYLFFIDEAHKVPWLAWPVIIIASLYAVLVVQLRPYKRNDHLYRSYYTTIGDTILIAIWVYATGAYDSPFYPLWLLSTVAVAYRYLLMETIIVTITYMIAYGIILLLETSTMEADVLAARFVYILLTGVTSGLMAGHSPSNGFKVRLQQSEAELRKHQENLEKIVEERTGELKKVNAKLMEENAIRRQYELKQKELVADLESINAELESFAYIVSHDLKAPLRGIATLSDWIINDLGDGEDDVKDKLSLLKERVLRMRTLIDGILKLSRIGRATDQKEWVDVDALIDEVIGMMSPDHKLKFDIARPLPEVWYDRTALFQIFENLISNACKYCTEGDTVSISGNDVNGHIEFSVKDTGPGIDPAFHERIFQIFQTAGRSRHGDFENSGVGLAIVKRIIEKNGGRVWVESQTGKGADFRFTVPRMEREVPELASNTAS